MAKAALAWLGRVSSFVTGYAAGLAGLGWPWLVLACLAVSMLDAVLRTTSQSARPGHTPSIHLRKIRIARLVYEVLLPPPPPPPNILTNTVAWPRLTSAQEIRLSMHEAPCYTEFSSTGQARLQERTQT